MSKKELLVGETGFEPVTSNLCGGRLSELRIP